MAEILEVCMVLCFGISWPASIIKSYRARTAKGKSLLFIVMIGIGYVCGIAAKLFHFFETDELRYPIYFYILNLLMIITELVLYFRNRRLDAARERGEDA